MAKFTFSQDFWDVHEPETFGFGKLISNLVKANEKRKRAGFSEEGEKFSTPGKVRVLSNLDKKLKQMAIQLDRLNQEAKQGFQTAKLAGFFKLKEPLEKSIRFLQNAAVRAGEMAKEQKAEFEKRAKLE